MSEVQIVGFHTCAARGGKQYVKDNAPFLSDGQRSAWLTQGYYFWTDHNYFAKIWGRDCYSKYSKKYAIVKCTISVEESLFLDLVGNTASQLYFQKIANIYISKLKKANSTTRVTIESIIGYWREYAETVNIEVFPFVAIKIQDTKNLKPIHFTLSSDEKALLGVTRQQLCLFESGKSCIRTTVVEEYQK